MYWSLSIVGLQWISNSNKWVLSYRTREQFIWRIVPSQKLWSLMEDYSVVTYRPSESFNKCCSTWQLITARILSNNTGFRNVAHSIRPGQLGPIWRFLMISINKCYIAWQVMTDRIDSYNTRRLRRKGAHSIRPDHVGPIRRALVLSINICHTAWQLMMARIYSNNTRLRKGTHSIGPG